MNKNLCDVLDSESEVFRKKGVEVIIIDSTASLYKDFISFACDNLFQDYNVNVRAYENLHDGLDNLASDKKAIVLCGVEGNAVEVGLYGKEFSWVGKYYGHLDLLISDIKQKEPNHKVVVFTGGGKYNLDVVKSYGADGYLVKPTSLEEFRDNFVSFLDDLNKEVYKGH